MEFIIAFGIYALIGILIFAIHSIYEEHVMDVGHYILFWPIFLYVVFDEWRYEREFKKTRKQ